MTASVTAEQTPFSTTLRESTKDLHERAHSSRFMTALFDGELTLEQYGRLVAQYRHIYGAIEDAADSLADDAVGGPFVIDELRRREAIERDLPVLLGEDWRERAEPVPATEDYVRRIRTVAAEWPGGYVAHHYVRYLGDLAGGQAVRVLLKREYGVEGDGASFYHFDIDSVPAFRKRYRALLDAAPWDEAERRRVVTESLVAFEFNVAVLADLAKELEEPAA